MVRLSLTVDSKDPLSTSVANRESERNGLNCTPIFRLTIWWSAPGMPCRARWMPADNTLKECIRWHRQGLGVRSWYY